MEIHTPQSEAEFQQLFEKACTLHQEGDFEKAEKIYSFILELVPDAILILYNYGLLLLEQGIWDRAARMYHKAAKLAPGNPDVLYNHALCLKQSGNFDETIKTYKRILEISPGDIDSLYNLGCCYKDQGDHQNAISTYHEVLQRQPDHPPTLNNIAYLYHKTGNLEEAKKHYSHLLAQHPDHNSAKYMLASLEGQELESAPGEYVKEVFDTYSDHYEQSLINELHYDVPNKMHYHFTSLYPEKPTFMKGLDLGCGTGLAASVFKRYCTSLTGVDISSKMLKIAAEKDYYDDLYDMDITEFLKQSNSTFDFIIAADVFTYLGALEATFAALQSSSANNAILCFSVETAESKGVQLRETGRFAHSTTYIQTLAKAKGWSLKAHFQENLRKERGQWIEGTIFFFQKK